MAKKIKKKKKPKKNGRPTKYKKIYAAALIKFFDIEAYVPKDITIIKPDGTIIEKSVMEPCDVPFFYDFCKKIDISTSTFDNWTDEKNVKKYPEFMEAYKKAWQLIEKVVTINGLRGFYSTAFAIFYAKNKFGWRDNKDVKLSGEIKDTVKHEISINDKTLKALGEAIVRAKNSNSKK